MLNMIIQSTHLHNSLWLGDTKKTNFHTVHNDVEFRTGNEILLGDPLR